MEQVATISHSAQTQCNTPVASGQTLPAGFPSVLGSPMSWLGSQYADASSYAVLLSSEDLAELQNALLQFKCTFLTAQKKKNETRD